MSTWSNFCPYTSDGEANQIVLVSFCVHWNVGLYNTYIHHRDKIRDVSRSFLETNSIQYAISRPLVIDFLLNAITKFLSLEC